MSKYADVTIAMKHAIKMDWSTQKWVNEVDLINAINPNVAEFDALTKCKDCKFKRYTSKPGYLGCDRHGYSFGLHPINWFCGDGTPTEE